MPGATLSRWTMSYFAAALVCLVAGLILMASGIGYPSVPIEDPVSLAVIHLIAIGWLGILFAGSLLQFVPVLASRQLLSSSLSLPTLLLTISGLLVLLAGFLGMADILAFQPWTLPLGGALLTLAFAALCWMVAGTLIAARPLALPATFVAIGCVPLIGVAVMGLLFTLPLSGLSDDPYLVALVLTGGPAHAYLGLMGWMTVTGIGVSYRLLAMFLLSPERVRGTSRLIRWLMVAALAAVMGGVIIAGTAWPFHLAVAITGVAILLYASEIRSIFHERKRKAAELNVLSSLVAVAMLVVSFVLFAISIAIADPQRLAVPAVYLFIFGWLTGLGLGQLYKIVAFMTWLEFYGPSLGRMAVPRVQDLVNERRASLWFVLYFGATGAATVALILDAPETFRWITAAQLAAVSALVVEFVQTRRLAMVPPAVKLPAGAPLPRLFLPSFKGRSQ